MQNQQIRITKTDEIQQALEYLHKEYPLLDDSELVKVALSLAVKKKTSVSTGKQIAQYVRSMKPVSHKNGGYDVSYKETYHSKLDAKYG